MDSGQETEALLPIVARDWLSLLVQPGFVCSIFLLARLRLRAGVNNKVFQHPTISEGISAGALSVVDQPLAQHA